MTAPNPDDELLAGIYVDLDDGSIGIVLPGIPGTFVCDARHAEVLAQSVAAAAQASRAVIARRTAAGN